MSPDGRERTDRAKRSVMVVAGEVSGDIHAANLLHQLRSLRPDLAAFGVGGDRLAAEGLEVIAHTRELAHMGLAEVVRELPRIRRILQRLVECARERGPAAAVLVDSPDFNLRLARRLKKHGIPVVLYVSPQLWAWRRGRVRVVRRVADEMLCILPFEVDFYKSHGVPARFVGHPLVDDFSAAGCLEKELNPEQGTLALLPGSRVMEVRELLPAMLDGVRRIHPRPTEIRLIEAPGVEDEISRVLDGSPGADMLRVRGAARREALARSELAWTASGTATLECALLRVPMIVGYRLHPASYFLARMLVRVPHVALVNLIAGERLAPELIQAEWNGHHLAAITMSLGREGLERQRAGLELVRKALGPPGASERAARVVARFLEGGGV